jgi:hypothetical protein
MPPDTQNYVALGKIACPTEQHSRNQRCAVSEDRPAGRVPLGRRLPACPTKSSQAAKV